MIPFEVYFIVKEIRILRENSLCDFSLVFMKMFGKIVQKQIGITQEILSWFQVK